MPQKGWRCISIPEEMVVRIVDIIDKNPDLGYRSIASFVSAAVRGHPDYHREVKK